ncbi:MAG TPA: prolipoprotein diacylglyceryl transferase family protein [Terracidiphilus sp.]|nr:prolipoprotein diacylglyceryl transferase family protein [Terracidiphilus sp.]
MHPILFRIGSLIIPSYGALAALGVLLALALVQRTARQASLAPTEVFNLCVLALCAALAGSRILLVVLNWTVVRTHPAWLLSLAMINHPLLAIAGAIFAAAVILPYARLRKLPMARLSDALAAPFALGLAVEQIGTFFAGSGYGTASSAPWAVTYSNPLALRWSGTPLFEPLHPVQFYSSLAFFLIALALLALMPRARRAGDIAGIALISLAAAIYFTELFRAPEGRGLLFHGAVDLPQLASVAAVLAGAVVLRERPSREVSHV